MLFTFKLRYRGRLAHPSHVYLLTEEVKDICISNHWDYHLWDEDWSKQSSVELGLEEMILVADGHAPLKGISFRPHSESEMVWLTFTQDGVINSILTLHNPIWTGDDRDYPWSRVVTGYDGATLHQLLCNLFRYLRDQFFNHFECIDETGYWDNWDSASHTSLVQQTQENYAVLQKEIDVLENETSLDADTKQAIFYKLLKDFGENNRPIREMKNSISPDLPQNGSDCFETP